MPADQYTIDPTLVSGGLLDSVLGKQTESDTTSGQHTTGTTNQHVTGTTDTTGTNNTNSVANTVGSTTNQQATTNSADLAALRSVYAKQSAGITPEMLAAIFTQGSKAAPNLVTAQAGALGARGVGNTPMAQVLNQLNSDLTGKAADVSRQLLADSGLTAANIAANTRSTNTHGTTGTNQTTTTDSTTDSTQHQINDQQVTGTQTQDVVAQEHKDQASTINTSIAKRLAGLAATGVGIDQLFRMATGQGFVGNIAQFGNYLKGIFGTDDPTKIKDIGINWAGSLGGTPGISTADQLLDPNSLGNIFGNTGGTNWLDTGFFADGGQPVASAGFLPVEALIKKKLINPNEDADLAAMLNAMGGSGGDSTGGGNGPATGAPSNTSGDSTGGASSAGGLQGGINSTPATSSQNAALSGIASMALGLMSANPLGIAKGAIDFAKSIDAAINGSAAPNAGNTDSNSGMAGVAAPGAGTAAGDAAGNTEGSGGPASSSDGGSSSSAGDSAGTAYADGGSVDALEQNGENSILEALGVSIKSNAKITSMMHSMLKNKTSKGYGDGGQINGPGTGTSDSIQAATSKGPIQVSNNEYIVPADVVARFGVQAFDNLVNQFHTPVRG